MLLLQQKHCELLNHISELRDLNEQKHRELLNYMSELRGFMNEVKRKLPDEKIPNIIIEETDTISQQ